MAANRAKFVKGPGYIPGLQQTINNALKTSREAWDRHEGMCGSIAELHLRYPRLYQALVEQEEMLREACEVRDLHEIITHRDAMHRGWRIAYLLPLEGSGIELWPGDKKLLEKWHAGD